MAPPVFISYSSRDKVVADAVVAALEAEGTGCWVAPRNILPGIEWSQAIVEGIRACRVVLLIFSASSNESPQVLREVERAVHLRIPIVTLRVEDAVLTPSMEYFISVSHWLVATEGPLENHLPTVVSTVQGLLSRAENAPTPTPVSANVPPSVHIAPTPTLLGNLPHPTTSLIGRDDEVQEVLAQLGTTRLLTLTGAGGSGKTRLALEVAGKVSPTDYSDGAYLVELAALTDSGLVPETIVSELPFVRPTPGQSIPDALVEALRTKHLLLVLDTCEHLMDACAVLMERLLKSCSYLRILATSREPINIGAEQTWRVPSLTLPDARRSRTVAQVKDFTAVQLFVDRARSRQPRFELTDANAPIVAHICRRLDGIPMALELAAARVKAMTVEQISQRLDDQFRLLAGGGDRTALPRQQTLRALIDWSFELLNEQERTLMARLSVFCDGFPLEAAETICEGDGIDDWEILDVLAQLVDKSLITLGEQDRTPRYRLSETLKAYSLERLKEAGQLNYQVRHAWFYRDLAAEVDTEIAEKSARNSAEAIERLEQERENLRLAHDTLLEENAGQAGQMALSLVTFWERTFSYQEARERLARCLARRSNLEGPITARLLRVAGWFAYLSRDYDTAEELEEEARLLYQEQRDTEGEIAVLNYLALIAQERGEREEARKLFTSALHLSQERNDLPGQARFLSNLGLLTGQMGDFAEAHDYLTEASALFARSGNPKGGAVALVNLSDLALKEKNWTEAESLAQESLTIFTHLGDKRGILFALTNGAEAALGKGTPETTLTRVHEALALCEATDTTFLLPNLLEMRARSLEVLGKAEEALFALAAASALRIELHLPRTASEAESCIELEQGLNEQLPEEKRLVVCGRAITLSIEEIFAEVLKD